MNELLNLHFGSVNFVNVILTRLKLLILPLLQLFVVMGAPLYAQTPKREFRAAWVTTFHNLDWPSSKKLSIQEQKNEYIAILDKTKSLNFNAIITQIRASGDAFYKSELAPWSEYLSGTQGKDPGYDPLAFMIEECHRRSLEFHAWFNPFRAISHNRFSSIAKDNLYYTHPDYFFEYGNTVYFNPGIPEVRKILVETVMEVVHNYDVDAIHFDDYFYPYKLKDLDLPDQKTYEKYGQKKFDNIEDWRRNNIDEFIEELTQLIHKEKPYVKFGISPHGVWRNVSNDKTGSISQTGHSSYDDLYSDTRKWLRNEWIDYIAPQLYWSTEHPTGNYLNLLSWWSSQKFKAHLYVGHALYKFDKPPTDDWKNADEIKVQVGLGRLVNKVKGGLYFRYKILEKNPFGVSDTLLAGPYQFPALIPSMKWKSTTIPMPPFRSRIVYENGRPTLEWQSRQKKDSDYFIVYRFPNDEQINYTDPANIVYIGKNTRWLIDNLHDKSLYAIRTVNRTHLESSPSPLVKFTPGEHRTETNRPQPHLKSLPNPNKT